MKKLSKQKKQQLILLGIATAFILGWLWIGLIGYQEARIRALEALINKAQDSISKNQKVVLDAAQIAADLKTASNRLAEIESTMPSGDLNASLRRTINQFNKPSYHVEIPQVGVPTAGEMIMIPSFPYGQASVGLSGSAYYHDLGRFVADFENQFPYARIQNLALDAAGPGVNPEEKEKLSFHLDIIALTKSANP